MNNIKVIVCSDDKSKVNSLWNESNRDELIWEHPNCRVNPTLTTNMGSPWYILGMSLYIDNMCSVPIKFLDILDKNQIRYLPEKEYYEKQDSYPV